MTLEEYKKNARARSLTFPSGLKVRVVLPPARALILEGIHQEEPARALAKVLGMLEIYEEESGERLTADDLSYEDHFFLSDWLNSFFGSVTYQKN